MSYLVGDSDREFSPFEVNQSTNTQPKVVTLELDSLLRIMPDPLKGSLNNCEIFLNIFMR